MKSPARSLVVWLAVAAGAGVTLGTGPSALAQDPPGPQPGGGADGGDSTGGSADSAEGDAGAAEAEALVRRIQASLAEVDAALDEASEASTAGDGIDLARRKHLEVIRDIDALIKQIKYQQSNDPKGQGGGKGGKGQSGGEPSGGKPAPRPSDGTQAPKPTGGKDGEKPADGEQGREQGGKKPAGSEQAGGKPGGNEQGNTVPPDETGKFTRTDTDARWGLLPPKLQERLMNLHVDDVPERYRAWLEAYIKALNSREQEGQTR